MFELPPSDLRKRYCTEPSAFQPQLKRQKLNQLSSGSQPPAAFWDSLSKIWLTEGALRELDRRNSPPRSQRRGGRRPVTRRTLAERKRNRRVTQSASDFLHHCGQRTLLDIKRFARNGGPDLSDLTGFPERLNQHIMSSNQSSSRGRKRGRPTIKNTRTTETSGPYSLNFEQKLIDGGIYPHGYEYPDGRIPPKPANLQEIKQRLVQSRSSLSPSRFPDEKFEEFQRADALVSKENKVTKTVIPIVEGKVPDPKCAEGDILFTNFAPLTEDSLTAAKPDLYYGARPQQLSRQARDCLSRSIIPSRQENLPIVPNFFLAAKGPNGTSAVARRQACYDGAFGARAMSSLQSYGQHETVYDDKAYTITSIYNDGQLKLYTSHPIQPTSPGGRPEYCMNQLRSFAMTDTADAFRQGATAFRNARDWTKEQRDEAIKRANEVSNLTTGASLDGTHTTKTLASNTSTEPAESETSADELGWEYEVRSKRSRKAG